MGVMKCFLYQPVPPAVWPVNGPPALVLVNGPCERSFAEGWMSSMLQSWGRFSVRHVRSLYPGFSACRKSPLLNCHPASKLIVLWRGMDDCVMPVCRKNRETIEEENRFNAQSFKSCLNIRFRSCSAINEFQLILYHDHQNTVTPYYCAAVYAGDLYLELHPETIPTGWKTSLSISLIHRAPEVNEK